MVETKFFSFNILLIIASLVGHGIMGDDVAEFALFSIFHEFQKRFACLSGNLKQCFCEIFYNVDKGLELNKFIDVRKFWIVISWVYDNA